MKYVYELKCTKSCISRFDFIATEVYTTFIVCDDVEKAVKSVLDSDSVSVEIVSVHPCLILD